MSRMIFINLPVRDLALSTDFYQRIGATKNPQFCDDVTANAMVFSDVIHVMLLTHEKFANFTPRRIADARETSEVLLCLSAESREAVDDMVRRAEEGGGAADPGPLQDYGFMYGRSFADPDGHIWEAMYMDLEAARQAMAAPAPAGI